MSAPTYCGPACGLEAVGCIDVGGIAVLRWTCWAEIEHWLCIKPLLRVCCHLTGVGGCRIWLQNAASPRWLGQLGTYTQVPTWLATV